MTGADEQTPEAIETPDAVETRIGTLEFTDGAPSAETVEKVYDQLDFSRGVEAFLNSFQGASLAAIRKGFLENGVKDNDFFLFSELMDSNSLFLTGNSDTVYLWGFVDLSDGPMVVDIPELTLPRGVLPRRYSQGAVVFPNPPYRLTVRAFARLDHA